MSPVCPPHHRAFHALPATCAVLQLCVSFGGDRTAVATTTAAGPGSRGEFALSHIDLRPAPARPSTAPAATTASTATTTATATATATAAAAHPAVIGQGSPRSKTAPRGASTRGGRGAEGKGSRGNSATWRRVVDGILGRTPQAPIADLGDEEVEEADGGAAAGAEVGAVDEDDRQRGAGTPLAPDKVLDMGTAGAPPPAGGSGAAARDSHDANGGGSGSGSGSSTEQAAVSAALSAVAASLVRHCIPDAIVDYAWPERGEWRLLRCALSSPYVAPISLYLIPYICGGYSGEPYIFLEVHFYQR